jgi:hypothetical protein
MVSSSCSEYAEHTNSKAMANIVNFSFGTPILYYFILLTFQQKHRWREQGICLAYPPYFSAPSSA